MKTVKSVTALVGIISLMFLFSCSSKGTIVSGGSSASTSNSANPTNLDTQDQTDDGNAHDLRNDTPVDTGTGH